MKPDIKLSPNQLENLTSLSKKARAAILKMTTLANSGHPGGSMSSIDYLLTLYNLANIDQSNPYWSKRDRIVISNGHISPAVYSVLGLKGFFDLNKAITGYRLTGSRFEGHVEPDVPGVEWASGNLGQGLSAACGFALASKQKGLKNHTFTIMGDGEQQKGQISEARRFAVKYELNRLIVFIDYNQLQISGDISLVMPQQIKKDWQADGWKTIEIDGHDFYEIHAAIIQAVKNEKPTVIIGNTIMGKGVSFMENKAQYHGQAISEKDLKKALKELGEPDDFKELQTERNNYMIENSKPKPKVNYDIDIGNPIAYIEKTANRNAWGNAIASIAEIQKDEDKFKLAVFDNDLQGSLKTKDFEQNLPDNFYECGIMEHHTAVMCGAMSKEGIQVFFPGFGVFGVDETYNQHRLNDINNTNLKIITTHVGLDVGEDGKTHQCIDYVGAMKNLFEFKIIIPADPNQTDRIIRYLVNKSGNYLVSMGRSKLEPILDVNQDIYFDKDYQFKYGKADQLRVGNDAALLVMGTLTGNAVKIADKLKEKGFNISVWNFSCPVDLDIDALKQAAQTGTIFTYEDHNINTGLGNSIADKLMQHNLRCNFNKFGVSKYGVSGAAKDVFKHFALDVESMVSRIKDILK